MPADNPTPLEGPLERSRSSRVSPGWAGEQIEQYGRDNAWVLVNVFGRLPHASLDA